MADRLMVVAVPDTVDNIADIRGTAEMRAEGIAGVPTGRIAVPIHSGVWGPGAIRRGYRLWGFWSSTALAGTRSRLTALRDAGRCRFWPWDEAVVRETHEGFLTRVDTALGSR
jgi:hypothetical protein